MLLELGDDAGEQVHGVRVVQLLGHGAGLAFRDQALSFCSRAGAEEASYRATSLATLVQMAAGGAGVTLLPSLAVALENRREALRIRPFAPREPARTLALAWRRNSALMTTLKHVGETLRGAYAALGSRAGL